MSASTPGLARLSARATAALLVVSAALVPVAALTPPAVAAGECAKWAATDGDDGNAGSAASPYRSLNKLVNSLAPGETGCLPAGETYYAVEGNGIIGGGGTVDAAKTITSGPGGRATLKGAVWVQGTGHDLRLKDLDLAGGYNPDGTAYAKKSTFLVLHGDRIALVGNDITNPFGICVGVGKGDAYSTDGNVLAEDVLIKNNVIHGCGMDPDITWQSTDSGAHGVYLEYTQDALVTDNLIYGNRYRGLQLWPRNDGAEITHNTFDENATQVNIGSSIACGQVCRAGAGFVSSNTDVHDNIFSNRVTDWRPGQNPSQVYGFFPEDTQPDQYGNKVHANCFAPGDPTTTGYGYQAFDNVTAAVTYADRSHRDYHLTSSSSCLGYGPAWLQPPGPADPPVVTIHDASVVEGDDGVLGELHLAVTRTGDVSKATTATVQYEDITATQRGDYDYLPSGEPLFEAGESESTLIFEVMGDDADEGDETFRVLLSDLGNGTLADGEAIGTILDDDGALATYRPDAQARKGSGRPWIGADSYGLEGSQVLKVRIRPGTSRQVQVRVQNDGTADDDWSFAEAGPGGAGVGRHWFQGRDDVTSDVDGGNLLFFDVPSGDSRKLTLALHARRGADPGTVATWSLHGVHDPLADGIRDVVTIRVRVVR